MPNTSSFAYGSLVLRTPRPASLPGQLVAGILDATPSDLRAGTAARLLSAMAARSLAR